MLLKDEYQVPLKGAVNSIHNHEDTEHCYLFSQQPEEQLQ